VGNLPFKLGHARALGSRIIHCVREGRTDRQTDRRTDKSNAYCLLPNGRGIIRCLRQCEVKSENDLLFALATTNLNKLNSFDLMENDSWYDIPVALQTFSMRAEHGGKN